MPPRTLGYAGLGIMGSAMAANLIKAGHRLTVTNRTPAKADPLVAAGAAFVATPRALAETGPEVVFLNVTDTPDVEHVLFAADTGLIHGARPGLTVVDHSTISPGATRDFAARLADKRIDFLDAPVSGGDTGARAGTLSVMVGGDAAVFARVRPVLDAVGQTITHVGPVGTGQAAKACNQVAVAVTLAGVCEALLLAESLGLDRRTMIDVVRAGAGGSWQLANLGPKIVAGDFAPGFRVDLVLKDLAIVADAARHARLPLPATHLAETLFRSVAAHGGDRLGTQAMAVALDRLAGVDRRKSKNAG